MINESTATACSHLVNLHVQLLRYQHFQKQDSNQQNKNTLTNRHSSKPKNMQDAHLPIEFRNMFLNKKLSRFDRSVFRKKTQLEYNLDHSPPILLVGDFNPFEKYARQNWISSPKFGVNIKKIELPPPTLPLYPIGSMYGIYLPSFSIKIYHSCR